MHKRIFTAVTFCLSLAGLVSAAEPTTRTVIYDEAATTIAAPPASPALPSSNNLWLTLNDLKRATRFEVKPKGVCRDELCFPLPKARQAAFLQKQGKTTRFNLSEFARLVRQPVAADAEHAVWFFGPRAEEQNGYVASLQAPDFKLPDLNGKLHALADFRGKKVLLVTWASW